MPALARLDVEKAQDVLAKCEDLRDCRRIRDQASAMTVYARAQKASIGIINSGTKIKLLAMARIGELTATHRNTGKPGRKGPRSGPLKREQLEEAGLSKQEANRCEKVAAEQGAIAAYVEQCTESGEVASEEGFRRIHVTKATSAQADHESDEWGSPPRIVEPARATMGSIDCDPASNARAQKVIRAGVYYTKKDDGLEHEWHGNIWLNSPYSMPLIQLFTTAMLEEYLAKRAKQAVVLVNNATETKWFQSLIKRFPACIPEGRIGFLDRNGKEVDNNRSGQVLFYIGPRVKRFIQCYADVGPVVGRLEA